MIIKKPYAFLIKYFKYIHIGLCLLLAFICLKSFLILKFFNDYVKNSYYTYYENLKNQFVGIDLFLIIILILVFGILLYLVMKSKNKNYKFYLFLSLFYIALIIYLIFVRNTLGILQVESIDIRDIRTLRDISIIAFLPQFYFVIFTLIRALGFDIKSFDFKKDLEELNISEEDSEIIEVLVPNETYKYMRKFRRTLRETKYFILEYKFLLFFIFGIVLLVTSISLYLNINVYNKKYRESDDFTLDNIKYIVKDSYVTSIDYSGKTINPDKSYVIVKLKVANTSNQKSKLNTDNFRLIFEDKYILPILSKNNYFVDIGQGYSNQYITLNEEKEFLIIFEIKNSYRKGNYIFRIYEDAVVEDDKVNTKNTDVKIYPINVDDLNIVDTLKLKEEILFGESNLIKSNGIVNSYEINDSFEESFNYEVNYKAYKGIKKFVPNIISSKKKTILKLECNYKPDDSLYINKEVNNCNNLIKYFGSIYYNMGDYAKTVSADTITSDFINKNQVFIEVPYEIKDAKTISLYLTIRNFRYIIVLK